MAMAIYIDDGETVKTYPVKAKVAKAVMTLLESDNELVWSQTHPGYGVEIVKKEHLILQRVFRSGEKEYKAEENENV